MLNIGHNFNVTFDKHSIHLFRTRKTNNSEMGITKMIVLESRCCTVPYVVHKIYVNNNSLVSYIGVYDCKRKTDNPLDLSM